MLLTQATAIKNLIIHPRMDSVAWWGRRLAYCRIRQRPARLVVDRLAWVQSSKSGTAPGKR